jgi:hypothetical protein
MNSMNEISEDDTTREALVKLAAANRDRAVSEWQSRTWYGKLWYPVWFLLSTIQWVLFAVFMTVILLAINGDKLLVAAGSGMRSLTPDVHAEDSENEECETA